MIPGHEPCFFRVGEFNIGLTICYDLRFPSLYLGYAAQGVDLIFAPSAFTVRSGKAHFTKLCVARALDSQAYIVAAAQTGRHNPLRETWGESCIVNPWGEIVAKCEREEGLIVWECTKEAVSKVREDFPLVAHRVHGIDTLK